MRTLLITVLLVAGCGDPPAPPPPPPVDAGPFDAGTGMDAMVDAAVDPDGGDLDGSTGDDAAMTTDGAVGTDGATGTDAGPDATITPFDAGPLPDATVGDPCTMIVPGTACTTGSCSSGERCLDNGCGMMRCYASGGPCGTDSDCPSGSTCTGGACGRSGGGCADSRDCPFGFSCDSGSCVDRRIGCDIGVECPQGFYCDTSLTLGAPYCVRANPPCDSTAGCIFFGACRDVTGTGQKICHISTGPDCRTNADCTMAGQVCGSHPVFIEAMCQPYGPCATAGDCASGSSCTDLWGDGVPECVPAGGSCAAQTDCSAGAVCAIPFAGGPPRCISRPI